MSELTQVMNMDFAKLFINIIIILAAIVFVVGVFEKFSIIIGKPVKWIKKNEDDHKILMDAVATMKSIQETHACDKKEVNDKNDNLEHVLSTFMDEMRNVIADTQNEIKQLADNRINDRQVSIEREKRLNDRIDAMVTSDMSRDKVVSEIGKNVSNLTDLFVNKEIEDLRWTILDFTASLSDGKSYNRESFDQIMRMYHKYERILDEHDMENGLVEESVKFIQEKYHEKLKNGFK